MRACVRACVRVCARVSTDRGVFLDFSIRVRKNQPSFFPNTITGSLLIIGAIAATSALGPEVCRWYIIGILVFGIPKTRQVLMVKAHDLEPIDLGSILAGGLLKGRDFRYGTPHR